jgi:hypothetical protein
MVASDLRFRLRPRPICRQLPGRYHSFATLAYPPAVDNPARSTARWEANVPAYRFYLLDAGGRVIEARDVACEDDARAEELARGIAAENPKVHAIEAWLRPRLICRIGAGGQKGAFDLDPVVRARPGSRRR